MQSTRHTLIKARLAWIRKDLDQIVERLTPDLMEWAPGKGMRTVAGQLVEIIEVEIPLVARLKEGRELSDAEWNEIIGEDRTLDSLRICLRGVRRRTLAYLDSLSESELAEQVSCGDPWFGSMWLPTLPRAEVFLNVAEHELYHVGQLTSYLWTRGDDPYRW